MPARGIHHVDLAVANVERSFAFYRDLLVPLGWTESDRYQTYRGTEEAVYLECDGQYVGLRPADGGAHHYYDVGIEHLAFLVDRRDEVEDAYARCLSAGRDSTPGGSASCSGAARAPSAGRAGDHGRCSGGAAGDARSGDGPR